MNKFKQITGVYCRSWGIMLGLIKIFESQGYTVQQGTRDGSDYPKYPSLQIETRGHVCSTQLEVGATPLTWMSVEEVMHLLLEPEEIPRLKVTRDYECLLTKKGLAVAGSIISNEKWEEIKALVRANRMKVQNGTFMNINDAIADLKSAEVMALLAEAAASKGFPVYEHTLSGQNHKEGFTGLMFHSDYQIIATSTRAGDSSKVWLDYGRFLEKIAAGVPPIMFDVVLGYTLVLSSEGIKVGCQTVTWDKYDELLEYIEKYTPNLEQTKS